MQSSAINVSIIKKTEESAVEVRALIPIESVNRFRAKAIKEFANEVSIDGFRKGNVPEKILVPHVGEAAVMERVASIAVQDELPIILARERILAIETPKVTITKLASGNPIEFTALITIMPEVTLPDYKTIAKKHNATKEYSSISDDEVVEMQKYLRREHAKIERIEKGVDPAVAYEESQKIEEKDLPPLDDVFSKQLGAESADALTERMRENMLKDKERRATEKTRLATIEEIIEKTTLPLPAILIEHELDGMLGRMAQDIEHVGSTLEAYLKEAGKTPGDLRKEWQDAAVKRAKMQVIVREIAAQENIKPDEEDIAHELEHLKTHHKDVPDADLRMHIESALLPDAVFCFLESQ